MKLSAVAALFLFGAIPVKITYVYSQAELEDSGKYHGSDININTRKLILHI